MIRKIFQAQLEAFKAIRTNILRTLLSILGIVIGVAALVIILSLIDGMEKYALDQISSTTSVESIFLDAEQYETVDGVRMKKENLKTIGYKDFLAMSEEVEMDGKAYLIFRQNGKIYAGDSSVGGIARFVNQYEGLDYELLEGDLPASESFNHQSKICAVSEHLAKTLFPSQELKNIIGQTIRFDSLTLIIAAVVKSNEKSKASFLAPYHVLPKEFLKTISPTYMIQADKVEYVNTIKSDVESWFNKRLGEGHDMKVVTNEFRVDQINQGFVLFRIIMGLIVGISVVVGGVGVMNVMIISVTERIKEIGIRKAIGAKRKEIMLQFLSESITISVLGSFIGLIVGVVFTMIAVPIVKMIVKAPFQGAFTFNTLLVISIIAVAVGIIFGTYPAIKASKLDPVDAIRHE